jgi:hypothetical protein
MLTLPSRKRQMLEYMQVPLLFKLIRTAPSYRAYSLHLLLHCLSHSLVSMHTCTHHSHDARKDGARPSRVAPAPRLSAETRFRGDWPPEFSLGGFIDFGASPSHAWLAAALAFRGPGMGGSDGARVRRGFAGMVRASAASSSSSVASVLVIGTKVFPLPPGLGVGEAGLVRDRLAWAGMPVLLALRLPGDAGE